MPPSPPQRSSPLPPVAGVKRSAASLLPAFEPMTSSPTLPRPLKRSRDALTESLTYPTPVPTSSTAIPSSSPPKMPISRPALQRFHSTVSERAPLSAVPTIALRADGNPVLMGRSSASCDYQLSSNRLISRVHVKATFKAASLTSKQDTVEVLCTGWNGVKVHCLGKVYELAKGISFTSVARNADIMVDVQDARVLLRWPPKTESLPLASSSEEESSPTKNVASVRCRTTHHSPIKPRRRIPSPVSPSPAVHAALNMPSSPPAPLRLATDEPVVIYEDHPSPVKESNETLGVSQSTQFLSQSQGNVLESVDSTFSDPREFSDHNEENDPIIHSFGPFGANILPRLASFTTTSPNTSLSRKRARSIVEPLMPAKTPPQPTTSAETSHSTTFDVQGHVINQLAFSRLSSTPLSTILSHLPLEAGILSKSEVRNIIQQTGCIGEVIREGKDAAGKPLESEYYYIPDQDEDDKRKEAVVNDLQKPGLRACRKQHKQYFWRKPK